MHHAEANVLPRLKCQRVNVIPPNGWFAGWHQSVVGVAPRQLSGLAVWRGDGNRLTHYTIRCHVCDW